MSRFFPVKWIVLSGIFLLSVVLLWGLIQKNESPDRSKIKRRQFDTPLRMKGISYKTHDNIGRLISRIEADEFKVNPRRFFVFNIKDINEITITNIKWELYVYENTLPELNLVSLSKSILPIKGKKFIFYKEYGRITRGVIENGFTVNVIKDNKVVTLVKAERGEINFSKGRLLQKSHFPKFPLF